MKIAITGANGFVGSNLANYFHRQGNELRALVRPGADCSLLDPAVASVPVDYSSESSLAAALGDSEILIHNAGKVRTATFDEMIQANVATTRQVLKAVNASSDCRRFLYVSSQAASRPSLRGEEITEEDASAPVDWYGRSKVLAERIIRAECAKDWTIVRPASVYGEGERDFFKLLRAIKSGLNIVLGDGGQRFNLIYVGELCEFINLCLKREEARDQLFFAADGELYSQSRFTSLAEELLGAKARNLAVPMPLARAVFHAGDIFERLSKKTTLINTQKMKELLAPNWIGSIAKARLLLGWQPQADLAANLGKTIAWYKEQGWL